MVRPDPVRQQAHLFSWVITRPLHLLLLLLSLPSSANGGNNAGGTVRLSWDPASVVTDRDAPATPFPIFLHLEAAPDVHALAIDLRWFPYDSLRQCYQVVPAVADSGCGWATSTPPDGSFDGDSSYTWRIVFPPLNSEKRCVVHWISATGCLGPTPADFVVSSVKVKDSAGAVDTLSVVHSA